MPISKGLGISWHVHINGDHAHLERNQREPCVPRGGWPRSYQGEEWSAARIAWKYAFTCV